MNYPVLMRPGFRDEDTWRKALGPSAPLLIASALIDCIDAPETMPAGSSEWRCLIAKGVGAHMFGAASTIAWR